MPRAFASLHPAVGLAFFVIVIVFTMLFLHPLFTGASLAAALLFSWLLRGRRGVRFSVLFCVPMFLLIAVANPLFNHRGKTMLFYFRNNPITLEAILYGLCAAAALVAVVLWFSCYNEIITADKFLYLFAQIAPTVSLLITMTLRMTPKLQGQLHTVAAVQRASGLAARSGNPLQRLRRSMRLISILLGWSMEDAIETADSMKARGYGLGRRTCFSLFKFDRRDALLLAFMLVLSGICFLGYFQGYGALRFYPSLSPLKLSPAAVAFYAAFAVLAFFPLILEIRETLKWRS